MKQDSNIHPIFDKTLQRADREKLLKQKAQVIWFTGLSGSGKSTLAIALEKELYNMGYLCTILDGDNIRSGINNNLGFSDTDRMENIRRIAEVSKLFMETGVITIAAFVSPTTEIRKLALDIIGKDDFIEVFVDTPLDVCETRDVKGLYKKARQGLIKDFTGVNAPFESPAYPDITIDTSEKSLEACTTILLYYILQRIKNNVKL